MYPTAGTINSYYYQQAPQNMSPWGQYQMPATPSPWGGQQTAQWPGTPFSPQQNNSLQMQYQMPATPSPWGGQQTAQWPGTPFYPQQNNSLQMMFMMLTFLTGVFSGKFQELFPELFPSLEPSTPEETVPETPPESADEIVEETKEVEEPEKEEWENDDIDSGSWGDPHFFVTQGKNKTQSFDFQGRGNTAYKMIDNEDFTLNAKFNDVKDLNARIITDQNLTLHGTDINIVSHRNGKFEVYYKGEKIADQSNYKELEGDERLEGIDLSFANRVLTVQHEDRKIVQTLTSDIRNNTNITSDDSGLLTQAVGALDSDGNLTDNIASIDLNKDGKISDNEKFHYTSADQALVSSKVSGISAPVALEGEDSSELAESFLNAAKGKPKYIDEAFHGAFEGADKITSPTDERLEIKEDDSEGVILAKKAMKATLEYAKGANKDKAAATEAVKAWIDFSTETINEKVEDAGGPLAGEFEENAGYSRSQWNELLASTLFTTTDSVLI